MITTKDKYSLVQDLSNSYSVKLLCNIAEISRSGYYKWLNNINTSNGNSDIENKILDIFNASKKVYGYRRIKIALFKEYKLVVNHKKVLRLMKNLNIQSVIRKRRFKYSKPKGVEYACIKDNILNRDFHATKPNEKWVTDITYLFYGNNRQKAYLSAIKDLYNNEIVSYQLSKSLDLPFVIDTVNTAVKRNENAINGLILHSDQGTHYTSKQYQLLLSKYDIIQSMSRRGNCYDNACIENFFGHLKSELLYQQEFSTFDELSESIDKYIHWYNNKRFQIKLNNRTPVEFRCAA